MSRRLAIYWISQITGWGLFVFGNIVVADFHGTLNLSTYVSSAGIFAFGIPLTHFYRFLIHKWKWKERNIASLLLRVSIASLIMGFVFTLVNIVFTNLWFGHSLFFNFRWPDFLSLVLNLSVLFLIWSALYFAVATYGNWKNEEIKNLELKAAKTEIELNSFRSQMNPHFMFNSLNSVRALIDEEPEKAKKAVTLLSGILRNNLLLGRKQLVPLKEELDLVEKYLELERIRFEERLHFELEITNGSSSCVLPPFMLQTIVENAVKHGISKRMNGGTVKLETFLKGDLLIVKVSNSGKLGDENSATGIGIANTKKRLELMYGPRASFHIHSSGDNVVAELIIPQHNHYATANIDR